MNLGVYFVGGYEKSNVVFASFSTSSKEKLDLYLEINFVLKAKVVENCVSFLSVIFRYFLLAFDMSFLQVFDSMLLINEIMINSHVSRHQLIHYPTIFH